MGQLLGCGSQQVSTGTQQVPAQDLHVVDLLSPGIASPRHAASDAQGLPDPCTRDCWYQKLACPLPRQCLQGERGQQQIRCCNTAPGR